jgi:putative hemolysin
MSSSSMLRSPVGEALDLLMALVIDDLVDLRIDLPDGEYATMAGLVLAHLGRFPSIGESMTVGHWRIEVRVVDGHHIIQLAIRKVPRSKPERMDAGP